VSGDGRPEVQPVDCSDLRIAVVAATWHEEITDGLLAGSQEALAAFQVGSSDVIRVPGSFELPLVAQALARKGYAAVVALTHWAVRRRTIGPFGAWPRFVRRISDPVLLEKSNQLMGILLTYFNYVPNQAQTEFALNGIALMLLGFGVANFAGTILAGVLLERSLRLTLTLAPLVIGAAGLALAVWHVGLPGHAVLVAAWGMAFGAVPVGWSTWMARAVPDETESAGGILVAAVQIAIAAGAAVGGSIFGFGGVTGVFAAGGAVLLLTAAAVFARVTQTNVTKVASPSPDRLVVCER